MLVEICGDYFNSDEINHIYTILNDTIGIELKNGEEYELSFKPEIYNCDINEYLQKIVGGMNMTTGRVR